MPSAGGLMRRLAREASAAPSTWSGVNTSVAPIWIIGARYSGSSARANSGPVKPCSRTSSVQVALAWSSPLVTTTRAFSTRSSTSGSSPMLPNTTV